jgi:hypothetical protein
MSHDEVADRLRAAVTAEADAVRPDENAGLETIRARGRAARRRRRALLAGAGVAALVAVAVAVPRVGIGDDRTVTTGPASGDVTTTITPAPTDPPATGPGDGDGGADPSPSGPPTTTAVPDPDPGGSGDPSATTVPAGETDPGSATFTDPPLWPFRSEAEVDAWRRAYQSSGAQPWHLDAEQTALGFTTGFLGFTGVDRVVGSEVGSTDAWVTVGYANPDGGVSPAAEIHLERFGVGDEAPWEVVGTRDDTLTVDTPRYGATVTSPLTVGGRITGVDESLRIQVRQLSSAVPLGESCCVPAGGEDMPWEATVMVTGATDPGITVVVSTGGHVADVERFAITAVRP